MNIFVLCAGRCGSVTFAAACGHMENYSSGHESRCQYLGVERLAFPENHIEVDNRLSWILGRLEETYGDNAVYVHLTRDRLATAASYNNRWDATTGILPAYARGVLKRTDRATDIAHDYVDTVASNIRAFLKDKSNVHVIDIGEPREAFCLFWSAIGAVGQLEAALGEFDEPRNVGRSPSPVSTAAGSLSATSGNGVPGASEVLYKHQASVERLAARDERLSLRLQKVEAALERLRSRNAALAKRLRLICASPAFRLGQLLLRDGRNPGRWPRLLCSLIGLGRDLKRGQVDRLSK